MNRRIGNEHNLKEIRRRASVSSAPVTENRKATTQSGSISDMQRVISDLMQQLSSSEALLHQRVEEANQNLQVIP
jgi:hypothetical protein